MLKVYTENIFIERVQIGATVKAEKLGFIFVNEGSITFEINTYLNKYEYGGW